MNKVKVADKNLTEGVEVVKQKRGRKPKIVVIESTQTNTQKLENIHVFIEEPMNNVDTNLSGNNETIFSNDAPTDEQKPGAKKRGRKPKGGKIIQNAIQLTNNKESKPNIILHLKCSLKDLQSNTLLSSNIESFNFSSNKSNLIYEIINSNENKLIQNNYNSELNSTASIKNSYHVYGCFCSPECATAHLMEENIDSSAKFERYHLINHIYSKIYDYKKNIKPAPNPFYLLDKYYGNLSIQEFRSLLRTERLFLVVDKPLTRILPELHEDNDDFIINNKIIPANSFSIKKKLHRKQQTKTNIVNEKFGVTS